MIFGEFETACMRLPRRFAPRNDMRGSFLTRSATCRWQVAVVYPIPSADSGQRPQNAMPSQWDGLILVSLSKTSDFVIARVLAPVAISQNCFKISINFRRIRSISHELSTADFTLRSKSAIPPESLRFQTKSPPFIRRALVRVMRLERTRRLSHAPQTCLSTYSSTLAFAICSAIIRRIFVFVNTFFRSCSFFPGLVQ